MYILLSTSLIYKFVVLHFIKPNLISYYDTVYILSQRSGVNWTITSYFSPLCGTIIVGVSLQRMKRAHQPMFYT